MSNENSETFIGVNSSWSAACCRFVSYIGDKPFSISRGDSKQATFYISGDGVGEILTLSRKDIVNLNSPYLTSSVSDKPSERLLRLVDLTAKEAFAFISDSIDLSYIRRLGYKIVILGLWAIVL